MRTTPVRLATATLLTTVLAAAGAVTAAASPAPTPTAPKYTVGTVLDRNISGMPYCPVGYGFVVIDHDQAVLAEGSGHFISHVLQRGQKADDAQGGTLTFNKDGKSITYNDYEHHDGRLVTEVCKPHA
ncbi:hypothetical protein ACFTWH_06835 [Streptomyces sp. NPDC057011]|uniref:hypothetical protein n=1 Tax=unclassified Streptomyces TaxID=2593676 RepID=UPI00363AC0F9